MADQIEIHIHIPGDIGLTEEQIAALKGRLRVEIVASTLPLHGFMPQGLQQIVFKPVDR